MLGDLARRLRPEPVGNSAQVEPDPRTRLAAAIEAAGIAAAAAQRATEAAERGRVAVTRARAGMASYERLDEAVAAHRAAALRDGSDAGELPRELVEGRRLQDVAARELADAVRTAAMLERGAADAAAHLEQERTAVRAIVDQVLQADAERLLAEMRAAERRAAELRVAVLGLSNSRASADPPLPPALSIALANEPHGSALLGMHHDLGDWTATARRWSAYRSRLAADPAARLEE